MRILITGHKGFIGQNMVKALSNHELSLFEWGDKDMSLDVDRVIHLGAISDTRCTDWSALFLQNYLFTTNLVSQCVKRNIPIQIASSASVYGNSTSFKETDTPEPLNLYAKSKRMCEDACLAMGRNSPVQFFRYFNVYGPHEDHKGDQASPFHKFREQAKTGTIKIFEGSENFKRDFVPVESLINNHVRFFDIDESGIWNIGTGEAISFADVARMVSLEIPAKIETIPMPEDIKAGYQKFTQADLTKLNRTLKLKE